MRYLLLISEVTKLLINLKKKVITLQLRILTLQGCIKLQRSQGLCSVGPIHNSPIICPELATDDEESDDALD